MLRIRRDHPLGKVGSSSDFVLEYLEALDCPRALTAWLLFAAGGEDELVQLVGLTCNPLDYNTVDSFRAAHAATKFLSKCADLPTGINTREVAIQSAVEAERKCSETNRRFRELVSGSVMNPYADEFHRIIGKVASILGPVPDTFPGIGWSKGRTTSSSGPLNSPYKKYGSRLDVTASAMRYAKRELIDSPWWGASVLESDAPVSVLKSAFHITKGNVLLTVPKNAKTDRVICYEPHMNIWLQLAVGNIIRRRLRSHGINLDDQSVNQRRAKLGSKTNHLATIDLRSASDTVSFELVRQFLPIEWVCLLDDLRSKYTLWPDGEWRKNEKFSSMGNGFTFELESLLFFVICNAVTNNVSVYGDDIVLPSSAYEGATQLLSFCGFEVNTKKSYWNSPFRESCGEESFLGASCTPVYLRSLPKTIEDVIKLHNQLILFNKRSFPEKKATRVWKVCWKWRRQYPSCLGPIGYGDGHYTVDLDEARPSRATFGIEGWWFFTYIRVYNKGIESLNGGHFASFPASICAATGPKRPLSLWDSKLDRRKFKYKRVRVLASFWQDTTWGA